MIASSKEKRIKKICIIRHGYFPNDRRVIKEVRALYDAGYSVDVICLNEGNEKSREVVNGVNVYRLTHQHKRGSLMRYAIEYGLSILKISIMLTVFHLKRHYDCIQVNTLPDFLVFTTVIPRLLGAKIVLDMHEPTPEMYMTIYGEKCSQKMLKLIIFLEQISIKFAHGVFAVNKTILERYVQRGANKQKLQVLRNVPPEEFGSSIVVQRENSKNGFTLLTHGTIVKRYGQEIMVRAVSLLRDKIKDLNVLIIGRGEDAPRVKSICEELGCLDIVNFTGYIPFSQVGEFLQIADVGVVPLMDSPFSELCQPNKLFEYIVYKKPVVCSRLKAVEESFDDSSIMFFEPGNYEDLARCVLELYNNPRKAERLAEQAYKCYENLMWSKAKKQYVYVIDSLVQ